MYTRSYTLLELLFAVGFVQPDSDWCDVLLYS